MEVEASRYNCTETALAANSDKTLRSMNFLILPEADEMQPIRGLRQRRNSSGRRTTVRVTVT
jgi:hypothetical protein